MANNNLNLVSQQRKSAEFFLKEHQVAGKIPKKVSGIICAKFGKYINVWQYRNNRLIGSISIDVNNIDAFYKKLQAASKGFDYADIGREQPDPEEDNEEEEQSNEE